MTAEPAALVRTFKVGKRRVTVTIPNPRQGGVVSMICEWQPDTPQRLSRREWREYRAGRDDALRELCLMTGERMMLVEL